MENHQKNVIIRRICRDQRIFMNSSKYLNEQRKTGKFCDFKLKTEDGGIFPVHKCVLDPISSFFNTMLNLEFPSPYGGLMSSSSSSCTSSSTTAASNTNTTAHNTSLNQPITGSGTTIANASSNTGANGSGISADSLLLKNLTTDILIMNKNIGYTNRTPDTLLVKNVSSEVMEKIIDFMYKGEIDISSENAKEILDTALALGLLTLIETCTDILIEIANVENCFELLSYSEKYFFGKTLGRKCIDIIFRNLKKLIDSSQFNQMTVDSIRMLVTHERVGGCTEEQLYLAVVKWITYDTKNREQFTRHLMDKIIFDDISYEFRYSKILKDNPLLWIPYKNFEREQQHMCQHHHHHPNPPSADGETTVIGPPPPPPPSHRNQAELQSKEAQTTMQLTHGGHQLRNCLGVIIQNDLRLYITNAKVFSTVVTRIFDDRASYGYTTYSEHNLFICGGKQSGKLCNRCEVFSMEEKCWKSLPEMQISRYAHSAVTLSQFDKIYTCGGVHGKSTCEIFDITSSKWSMGPSLNQEMSNFGLCTLKSCIYAADKNSFERLDPRDNNGGRWASLPSFIYSSEINSILGYDNYIYAFNKEGIALFDLRNNKWLRDMKSYEKRYKYEVPKACQIGNEIYVFALTETSPNLSHCPMEETHVYGSDICSFCQNLRGHKEYLLHLYNASDLTMNAFHSGMLPSNKYTTCDALFAF